VRPDDLAVLPDLDPVGPMKRTGARTSTGRPTAAAETEYLLLSKRTRQVFETDAVTAWKPSKGPR
jgi:hypothetical protein